MRLHRVGLAAVAALGLFSGLGSAQQNAEPASSVNWFWAICDTRAVVDLDGTMAAGDDVFIQFFRETQASGAPLSGLIQIGARGAFRTSQVVNYPAGTVLAPGQFGSMRISIARANNPQNASFTTVVDDVFDTCIEPSNPVGTITTVGSDGTATGATGFVDPETGQNVNPIAGRPIRHSGILKPGSGFLNEVFAVPAEQPVQIGARPSANVREQGRTTNPGLIFAECAQFPGADPGRIFDTDNIRVFWSWFGRTAAQVRDHIAKAQYEVLFESPGFPPQAFPNVVVSPIVRREDGRFWVFYTVDLGTAYRPGVYRVNYRVTWSEPTFDGFENFGPGTENEELRGHCVWTVEPNPYGVPVAYENPRLFER